MDFDKIKKDLSAIGAAIGAGAYAVGSLLNSYNNYSYNRCIGLANQSSRNWTEGVLRSLNRNIGGLNVYGLSDKERVATPIGWLANPEYNQEKEEPWFISDTERNRYYDYLDYVDTVYFKGRNNHLVDFNNNIHGVREFDAMDALKNNGIAVIRKIENWETPIPTATNVNDTRLGMESDYYVKKTLLNAQEFQESLGYSNYIMPEDDSNATASREGKEIKSKSGSQITRGAYHEFGPNGRFGISGNSNVLQDKVISNSQFIGEIIPWATSDHVYDTRLVTRDLDRVEDIQKLANQDNIDYYFLDKAQNTEKSHEYFPFGNYYSMTYSLGLIAASGERTQQAIANSMLGYPLTQTEVDNSGLLTGDSSDKIVVDANKKYYVGNGTRGTNYIDKMTACTVKFVKHGSESKNKNIVRLELQDAGNDNLWSARSVFQHREAEGNTFDSPLSTVGKENYNRGSAWGNYVLYDKDVIATKPDIIKKTNELFMNNKIKTIIGRFHTDEVGNYTENRMANDFIGSATSQYGASRGRNLLRKDHGTEQDKAIDVGNGYSNPYCRVWTYHHEYATMQDLMRPFIDKDSLDGSEISRYRTVGTKTEVTNGTPLANTVLSWDSGQHRLEKYGARIKSNKLVRFAPTRDGNEGIKDQLKRLMFSIENLAWKDCQELLDEDQKGPLGGRIMWFPPYNLEFSEQVSTQWNEVEFIGRGEKIPTYINTNRGGNLSFDILVDHPSVVNSFNGKGIGGKGVGDVDDVESYEQTLLRFFAGCEVLDKTTETYVMEQEPPKPNPPSPITVEVPEVTEQGAFSFYIFYPNNYSGVDDRNDMDLFTNYMLQGIGSGYLLDSSTNKLKSEINTDDTFCCGYEINEKSYGLSFNNSDPTEFDNEMKRLGEPWRAYHEDGICSDKRVIQKWAYRIDNEYKCQVLGKGNYCDVVSYGFNSTDGYLKGAAELGCSSDTENLFAFTEVYVALTDDKYGMGIGNIVDKDRVLKLKNKIDRLKELKDSDTSKTTITISSEGYASSHGYTELNKKLYENRANTAVEWLKSICPILSSALKEKPHVKVPYVLKDNNVNDFRAKASRAAKVTVSYKTEALVTNNEKNSNVNILDNAMEDKMAQAQLEYNDIALSGDENALHIARTNTIENANITPEAMRTMTNVEYHDRFNSQREWEEVAKVAGNTVPKAWEDKLEEDKGKQGYRNEYKFFSELEKTDSFLHDKIVDKIKFFDPAFHSITPEGYQARLTFLHQCTRQGSTSAWTDNTSIRSASNLAFGRPPILVLRIGDFYNTKIAVTSLSIDFKNNSGISWDLNDEGIGIMPMYAHVSMSFNFYGGSDLGGPISRLQNAVSFNYYANTSVYDNRSEMVEYDDNGNLTRVKEVDIK